MAAAGKKKKNSFIAKNSKQTDIVNMICLANEVFDDNCPEVNQSINTIKSMEIVAA